MNRNAKFFMLPNQWHLHPDIAGLAPGAICTWISIVEYCQQMGNGGRLTGREALYIARSFPRGAESLTKLIDRGSLAVDPSSSTSSAAQCQASAAQKQPSNSLEHMQCQPSVCLVQLYYLRSAAQWLVSAEKRKQVSAGQDEDSHSSSEPVESRARVRVKDRQTDRENERTPTGSVRSFSARAAPRSTGGATRPALPDGDRLGADEPPMKKNEALEMARKEIAKTRGPNPGKAISFSRYDPNRRIVPLPSGLSLENGTAG